MTLAKWGSNSSEVTKVLQWDFADKALDEEFIKVLGMYWLASPDCFTFRCAVLPESLYLTKGVVLSLFSRLFDPLGFAAPFIMQAKCLFQELWKLGLQWDQEIPPEFQIQFLRWIDGLKALGQWRIPRSFTGSRWCDIRSMQLHGFGDASPKGYGACVYLQAEMVDGTCCSSLIIAKSRVAPLKQVTLPRLELLGALLCARLLVFARDVLGLSGEVQCRCWTDSIVTSSQDLGHRFELRKTVFDQFWVVWTTDYIRNLPPWKGTAGRCEVKIGSVVLVQDVNQPRLKWPLGIVTQVFPGRDGVVHTVEVRMAKGGKLVRSVPRIHDLEIVNDNLSDRDNIEANLGPSDQSNRSDVNVSPSEKSNQSDDTNVGLSGQSNVSDNGLCAEKPYGTRHGHVVKRVKKFSM